MHLKCHCEYRHCMVHCLLHTVKRSTAHMETRENKSFTCALSLSLSLRHACARARAHTHTQTLNGIHYCTCKRCTTVTGWLSLPLDRVKGQDLVNTIMNLQVLKYAWNFLTSWGSISFPRMTVLLVQSARGLNTGCFTTCGHYCRRWFPKSLWSKKFI